MQIKLTIFFVLLCLNSLAQNCPKYDKAMESGNYYLNKIKPPNYDKALIEFQAAQIAARECGIVIKDSANDPSFKLKRVFAGLVIQRNDAIKAKHEADKAKLLAVNSAIEIKQALSVARNEKLRADSALFQAQKLTDAFYFYDEKYALAFNNNKYGFINKKGDPVIPYIYEKAEQFDFTGFAKVKLKEDEKMIDYLIDTFRNTYKLAYTFKELKDSIDFKALDLRDIRVLDYQWRTWDTLQSKIKILIATDGYFMRNDDVTVYLPHTIGELKSLTHLYLNSNGLGDLPKEIGKLESLQYLDLTGNQLTVLPAELGQLKNLQTLNLSGNLLTALPAEIGQLKNLQTLNLSGNQLTALPAEIGQLKKLQTLNLYRNQLTVLPAEIGQLEALQTLNLDYNKLKALPAEIGRLKSLQKLDLNSNPLSLLPAGIGQLKNLRELNLEHDGEYSQITTVSGEALKTLPPEIGLLKNLQFLNLANEIISVLPEEIGQLTSLQRLDLTNNQLSVLPAGIGQLKNLKELRLGHGWYAVRAKLTTLPREVSQLKNLEILNLAGNPISGSELKRIRSLLPGCTINY